jgi:hypothetical protein
MSEQSDRRLAVARRLVKAGKALRVFNVKNQCWVNRATEQAMKQAEAAFASHDYDRAEHFLSMTRRDTAEFQANPKAWIAKMREAAA